MEYLFNISYFSEGGAKEIRLNSLQDWYMKKNEVCRGEMVRLHFKSFKMAAFINIIIQLLVAIQSIIILVLLSRKFVIGDISLAEFTMYFSAITTLTVYLSLITEHLSNYNQQILGISDYKKITNLISKDENTLNKDQQQKLITNGIEINFENISFAYPNTNTLILKKINLKISNKEKLLIVGMNGSGKSTLIKLLCKFYHPTSGKILINGVDIWSIPNQDYYKIISSVFQDYANFAFSIKENISMSEKSEEIKITKIIEDVGLKARIEALPKGYDTFLSRKFDTSGIELSGGQAQKLAIARAIYKDASILILDEPTANLDPKAESEIYEDFFNMSKGKTTIFISHRLAASKLADNIAVFSKGEIVEYGPHDTLISKNGVYAEMYRKQSEQYISKEKIF